MVGFTRNRRRYRAPWQHRYWQWRAKVVAWLRVVLAILACWLLFVAAYLGFAEPAPRLIVTARWAGAALLDTIGLDHWTWAVTTKEGDEPWRSSFIRIDSWHLDQVEAVLAAFWTGMAWAAGLTLLGFSLTLAWWLGKRRVIARYERQPAVPAAQHLAAGGTADNRPGAPDKLEEHQGSDLASDTALVTAAIPDGHEQVQPVGQDDEKPDIEGLFQQDQGLEVGEEAQPRKPVARHNWHYRPC